MEICNKKCYWNYDGNCCSESEESCNSAKPSDKDCPTYLREDFDKYFWETLYNIRDLVTHRRLDELEEIQEFIINQRKGVKNE